MADEVCPYEAERGCDDPACHSRIQAHHSYIPLKRTPLVPYSWRTHVAGFAILLGVTAVAAISLKVLVDRNRKWEIAEQKYQEKQALLNGLVLHLFEVYSSHLRNQLLIKEIKFNFSRFLISIISITLNSSSV